MATHSSYPPKDDEGIKNGPGEGQHPTVAYDVKGIDDNKNHWYAFNASETPPLHLRRVVAFNGIQELGSEYEYTRHVLWYDSLQPWLGFIPVSSLVEIGYEATGFSWMFRSAHIVKTGDGYGPSKEGKTNFESTLGMFDAVFAAMRRFFPTLRYPFNGSPSEWLRPGDFPENATRARANWIRIRNLCREFSGWVAYELTRRGWTARNYDIMGWLPEDFDAKSTIGMLIHKEARRRGVALHAYLGLPCLRYFLLANVPVHFYWWDSFPTSVASVRLLDPNPSAAACLAVDCSLGRSPPSKNKSTSQSTCLEVFRGEHLHQGVARENFFVLCFLRGLRLYRITTDHARQWVANYFQHCVIEDGARHWAIYYHQCPDTRDRPSLDDFEEERKRGGFKEVRFRAGIPIPPPLLPPAGAGAEYDDDDDDDGEDVPMIMVPVGQDEPRWPDCDEAEKVACKEDREREVERGVASTLQTPPRPRTSPGAPPPRVGRGAADSFRPPETTQAVVKLSSTAGTSSASRRASRFDQPLASVQAPAPSRPTGGLSHPSSVLGFVSSSGLADSTRKRPLSPTGTVSSVPPVRVARTRETERTRDPPPAHEGYARRERLPPRAPRTDRRRQTPPRGPSLLERSEADASSASAARTPAPATNNTYSTFASPPLRFRALADRISSPSISGTVANRLTPPLPGLREEVAMREQSGGLESEPMDIPDDRMIKEEARGEMIRILGGLDRFSPKRPVMTAIAGIVGRLHALARFDTNSCTLATRSRRAELRLKRWALEAGENNYRDLLRQALQRGLPILTLISLDRAHEFAPPEVASLPLLTSLKNGYRDQVPTLPKNATERWLPYLQRVEDLLQRPQARAFLGCGGILWRLAVWFGKELLLARALEGPSLAVTRFKRGDVVICSGSSCVDDSVSPEEVDVLLGRFSQGKENYYLWPPENWFAVSKHWSGEWDESNEEWFLERMAEVQNGTQGPKTMGGWKKWAMSRTAEARAMHRELSTELGAAEAVTTLNKLNEVVGIFPLSYSEESLFFL